jgi:hypothetical protein
MRSPGCSTPPSEPQNMKLISLCPLGSH